MGKAMLALALADISCGSSPRAGLKCRAVESPIGVDYYPAQHAAEEKTIPHELCLSQRYPAHNITNGHLPLRPRLSFGSAFHPAGSPRQH